MNLLLGSLLLAGVCWLGAATNIPVMANFNNRRIAKAWYPLLSIPIGQLRSVQFHPFQFVAQPNGNLKYRARFRKNGRCVTENVMLNKQSQPGDYVSSVPSTVRFVETDYNTYFIAYVTQGSGNPETFLALAGTQPNVTPALETKFRTVANSLGVTRGILQSVQLGNPSVLRNHLFWAGGNSPGQTWGEFSFVSSHVNKLSFEILRAHQHIKEAPPPPPHFSSWDDSSLFSPLQQPAKSSRRRSADLDSKPPPHGERMKTPSLLKGPQRADAKPCLSNKA